MKSHMFLPNPTEAFAPAQACLSRGLKVICAWCNHLIRYEKGGGDVSHGICFTCSAKLLAAFRSRRAHAGR